MVAQLFMILGETSNLGFSENVFDFEIPFLESQIYLMHRTSRFLLSSMSLWHDVTECLMYSVI